MDAPRRSVTGGPVTDHTGALWSTDTALQCPYSLIPSFYRFFSAWLAGGCWGIATAGWLWSTHGLGGC